MNTNTQDIERRISEHIHSIDGDLPALEEQLGPESGSVVPELQNRLHQVEVMEHAMRRNFQEVMQDNADPSADRVHKLRSLCRLIEEETEALKQEADFITMFNPTSVEVVAKGMDKLTAGAREVFQALSDFVQRPARKD